MERDNALLLALAEISELGSHLDVEPGTIHGTRRITVRRCDSGDDIAHRDVMSDMSYEQLVSLLDVLTWEARRALQ